MNWPDWRGETAIVVATGPSAAEAPLSNAVESARFIAIKSSWQLTPWADVVYGLDKGWWIANRGLPHFKGMKVSPAPTVNRMFPSVRPVRLKSKARVLVDETGVLGCGLRSGGGHSGFQAINLAVQFGSRRILLVGFDMRIDSRAHWNGSEAGVARPDAGRIETWRREMDACAPQFAALGVELINCCMNSALVSYPKVPFDQIFKRNAA